MVDTYLADEKALLEFLKVMRHHADSYSEVVGRRVDYMIAEKEAHIKYLETKHYKK